MMFECNCGDRKIPYHSEQPDFKVGKLYVHDRRGSSSRVRQAGHRSRRGDPAGSPPGRQPPDGPLTHW